MCVSSIVTTFTQQSAFTVFGASFTLKFKCNFNLLGKKSQVKMYSPKFKYHILVIITFFFKFNYAKLKGCSDENIEYLELCHKVRSYKRGVSNSHPLYRLDIQRVPALRAFWDLEKTVLHEIRVSGTVLWSPTNAKIPTCTYISQKPC